MAHYCFNVFSKICISYDQRERTHKSRNRRRKSRSGSSIFSGLDRRPAKLGNVDDFASEMLDDREAAINIGVSRMEESATRVKFRNARRNFQ